MISPESWIHQHPPFSNQFHLEFSHFSLVSSLHSSESLESKKVGGLSFPDFSSVPSWAAAKAPDFVPWGPVGGWGGQSLPEQLGRPTLWQTNIAGWKITIFNPKHRFHPGPFFPASYVSLPGWFFVCFFSLVEGELKLETIFGPPSRGKFAHVSQTRLEKNMGCWAKISTCRKQKKTTAFWGAKSKVSPFKSALIVRIRLWLASFRLQCEKHDMISYPGSSHVNLDLPVKYANSSGIAYPLSRQPIRFFRNWCYN